MDRYVRVREVTGGEEFVYLTKRRYVGADDQIIEEHPSPTLEEVCELLDSEAESENYHGLVGFPNRLAAIITKAGGTEEMARKVMVGLLERGWPIG